MPAVGIETATLVLHGPNVNRVTRVFAEEPIAEKRQASVVFTSFMYERKLAQFIRNLSAGGASTPSTAK